MAKLVQVAAALIVFCLASPSLPVSASSLRQLLQDYDDSAGAGNWRIANGIEAECGGTGYPTSNWGGQTRLRHFRSNGFIIIQIRITINVILRGFFGERFTTDSTFTFRFTEDNYNSYRRNNFLWTPAAAATLVKLSDGNGNFVTVQTSVTVNIQQWTIRIFEVVRIIANSCPQDGGCSGGGCGQAACGQSDCGTADAPGFSGGNGGGSSSQGNSGGSSGTSQGNSGGSSGSSQGNSGGSSGSSQVNSGGSSGSNDSGGGGGGSSDSGGGNSSGSGNSGSNDYSGR